MPADNQPHHRNVIIFGDVGSGKSSLINLIGGTPKANISSGVQSCTLQSKRHTAQIGPVAFALYDTAGMHNGQENIGSTEYLEVVYQAHKLISELERTGGISLLVFCMQGGRIRMTMQHTYNLFVEVLCNSRVPVVIAVTHLEMVQPMEKWWKDNEANIIKYGLRSDGHACLTTTRGLGHVFNAEYEESMEAVQGLLLDYSDRIRWKEEQKGWLKRVAMHIRQWLSLGIFESHDSLKKKLMKRCGLSESDADAVARKIHQTRREPSQTLPGSSGSSIVRSASADDGKPSYDAEARTQTSSSGTTTDAGPNNHIPTLRMVQVPSRRH